MVNTQQPKQRATTRLTSVLLVLRCRYSYLELIMLEERVRAGPRAELVGRALRSVAAAVEGKSALSQIFHSS